MACAATAAVMFKIDNRTWYYYEVLRFSLSNNTASHALPSNLSCDCVTCVSLFSLRHPRDFTSSTSYIPKGNLVLQCTKYTFSRNTKLFSCGRGFFPALSIAGHAGVPPVHGASLCPGRAPWRVLWAFKVAKSGN